MPLRVALADDEPVALNRLGRLLREAGCEVLQEFEDGHALLEWMKEDHPLDALFLDIHMPNLSGIEVLAELENPPAIVFVTANAEYAVQAFEHAALDFLVKPVTAERLEKTLARLQGNQVPRRSGSELKALLPPANVRFPVKAGDGKLLLELKRVSHFEVIDQVVWVHAGKQKFRTTWVSLTEVEQAFPGAGLMRIQRHLLLRPEAVLGIRSLPSGRRAVLVAEGVELEASRSAAHSLKQRLGL
ncbi:MAG TPA: LytTR family DNA-binding domain-containing protein [Holophagaceae bacterium]|nr:LytTR family DNA-binding domain-containing protein [Holophagaceae bacterium]